MGVIYQIDSEFAVEFRTRSTTIILGADGRDVHEFDNDELWKLLRWFDENRKLIRTKDPEVR